MTQSVKALHLVVDAGALIHGTDLTSLAENFWTVPDVLNEIRDRRARRNLERLPFELKTREPSSDALNAIKNFARLTGDFAALSLTDLRVMALTYMLETEINGIEHIKTIPEAKQNVTRSANSRLYEVPCKYYGTAIGCKYGNDCKFIHEKLSNDSEKISVQIPCRFFSTENGCINGDNCVFSHEQFVEQEPQDDDISEAVEALEISEEIRSADVKSRIISGYGSAISNAGADEDDGRNWITAENAAKYMNSPFGEGQGAEPISEETKVACITTDFTMQNVLLQMKLNILSSNGMVIRRVKQWILKCVACFATSTEMERLFCPRCGNSTLERVSYSIGADGQMTLYTRANRPAKLTGTKYSLPKPKGGRQGDLLLREDQLMMGIWGQRQKQHHKIMNSAFGENVAHDLGVKAEKHSQIVVGYGRMNPNAQKGRERRGKKKKH